MNDGNLFVLGHVVDERKESSRWRTFVRSLSRSRAGVIGGLLVTVMLALAAFGRIGAPYDPNVIDLADALEGPSQAHWLGTDNLGRDTLTRILVAARLEIEIAFLAVLTAAAVGVPIGLIAGYAGGWYDRITVFLVDTVLSLPAILLAMTLVGIWGAGVLNIGISIGVVSFPVFARLTRASTLSLKFQPFVDAARVLGASDVRIMASHILPNAVSPLIVQGSLLMGFAILAESGLSFLGLGIAPPEPSWGGMLRLGMDYLRETPYLTVFPGLAIFLTVLGFSLLGDGLTDALDPRGVQR